MACLSNILEFHNKGCLVESTLPNRKDSLFGSVIMLIFTLKQTQRYWVDIIIPISYRY